MLHKLPSWARSQGTAAPCQPSLAHRRLFRLQRATHHLLSPRAYRCSETIHGIIYVMKLLLASSLPGTFSSSFPSSASSYFYGILASPQGMLAEPLPRASLFRILHETTPKTPKSHTSTWTSIHTHTHQYGAHPPQCTKRLEWLQDPQLGEKSTALNVCCPSMRITQTTQG